MKYWLIYDTKNKLIGCSTYKQFDGQEYVEELPLQFVENERHDKDLKDNQNFLKNTNDRILEYLEQLNCDEPSTLSKKNFKDLCGRRKEARQKINDEIKKISEMREKNSRRE